MRHILAVDDDMHIGHAIRIWLKHHGFLVSTADSGPGGLAALDNAKSASAGAEAPTEAMTPRREVVMTWRGVPVQAWTGRRRNAPLLEPFRT